MTRITRFAATFKQAWRAPFTMGDFVTVTGVALVVFLLLNLLS